MSEIRFPSVPKPNGRKVAIMLHECGAHFAFYAKEEHRHPYAIADIALLPYVASMALSRDTDLPSLRRWKNQLPARAGAHRHAVHGRSSAEHHRQQHNQPARLRCNAAARADGMGRAARSRCRARGAATR